MINSSTPPAPLTAQTRARALQEGFDKLFAIIRREGVDGSTIVCDCLRTTVNLLTGNSVTQEVRACVRACVHACVHACVCVHV